MKLQGKLFGSKDPYGRVQIILTALIQMLLSGALFFALLRGEWVVVFVNAIAMIVIWLPLFFARKSRVHIPIEFEFILAAFVYSTLFLGEIHDFYTKFWWWDVMLHTGSGIALGFIGFLILYSLYRNGRLVAKPGILAMFSFSFAMSLGAVWEVLEYGLDNALGLNMQKSGLQDTVWDLIVDALGASITAISGYFYLRYHKRGVGILEYYLTSYFRRNAE